ncbi:MAG: hypothetical protein V5A44_13640 [Haloarculaceae archaeon]
MSEECDDREVLALLNDEYARAILTETSATTTPTPARTTTDRPRDPVTMALPVCSVFERSETNA